MSNKKILITGAAGFIGQHLHQYFVARGFSVIAFTSTQEIEKNKVCGQIYNMNLPDERFGIILEQEKPDFLIHCAGTASVSTSFINPREDFIKNVVVTEFVLASIKQYSPTTKMIFLSSAAVYGNPTSFPINVDTPTNPISPYGFHKLMCEINCKKYHQLFGIQVAIARIFSVYGPGLKKQLLWDIYQKGLYSDKISLYGTGKETRDFIYVTDLVEIIGKIIQFGNFNANIINIGTGKETTIDELARLFVEKMKTSKTVQFNGKTREGDPSNWLVDVKDILALGMNSWLPLNTGIKHYLDWLSKEGKT